MISITQKQVYGRIADALLYFTNSVFSHSKCLRLTRADLSEYTGMTKDTAGKILNELAREGIIGYEPNNILILDHEKLKQLSMKS